MVEGIDQLGSIGAVLSTDSAASYDSGSGSTSSAATPSASTHDLQNVVNKVNDRLSSVNRVLELSVDASSGLTVATIRNSDNGEILQQFPGTDALHLAKLLADWSGGKNALLDLIA